MSHNTSPTVTGSGQPDKNTLLAINHERLEGASSLSVMRRAAQAVLGLTLHNGILDLMSPHEAVGALVADALAQRKSMQSTAC